MEVICSSETSVEFYRTARCHISENIIINLYENVKSDIDYLIWRYVTSKYNKETKQNSVGIMDST
jgi:hypothetical protein